MGLISFVVLALLLLGESVSSDDDDDEEFTVTDGTFTQCPKHGDSSLSRWLSQRSDVSVSLWLLSYTELERNVWCSEDQYAECRGAASHSNPAPEGSSLSLTCEDWGLSEVQKWEWTRNSAVISGTRKYMNNARLNTLTIRSLEKKSDGGTYRCKPVFQQIELKYSVSIEYTVTIAGESVSSDDDEEFTVTDGTFTLCPNKKISSLSRWLSQRSDVRVSLWLLNYTGLERNVWCSEDQYAECRGLTIASTSTPEKTTTDQVAALLVAGAALVMAVVAVAVVVWIIKKNRDQTQGKTVLRMKTNELLLEVTLQQQQQQQLLIKQSSPP
ncbi:UNVERIFIED_CONTAM: hypothetical protein FKN15_073288 [Acipenser sinensis]